MSEEKKVSEQDIPWGELDLHPNASTYLAEALVEHGVEIAFGVSRRPYLADVR